VRIASIRELEPWFHGEYRVNLENGTQLALSRNYRDKLQEALGETVVIDNRPGAGGVIGDDAVAKATPDGHTLLIGAFAHAVNPSLLAKMPFRTPDDFAPISLLVTVPELLVITPSHPAKTVAELVAMAKAQPGKLFYASSGNGSAQHLAAELFKLRTGTDIGHVPYKGGAPAVADVAAGHVPFYFGNMSSALPQARAQILPGQLSLEVVLNGLQLGGIAGFVGDEDASGELLETFEILLRRR